MPIKRNRPCRNKTTPVSIAKSFRDWVIPVIFFVLTWTASVFAQPGMRVPEAYPFEKTAGDSNTITFSRPVLPLQNWSDFTDRFITLEQSESEYDLRRFIPTIHFPDNPLMIDMRGTSNYVPPIVRDELNLIMNRPKDAAFLPILPVAFLAVQMAAQYLIVHQKTVIGYEEIINSRDCIDVLECLWANNPQTATMLFKCDSLQNSETMHSLQNKLDVLLSNKLIRPRVIENAETKYFPALSKIEFEEIERRGKLESNASNKVLNQPADLK